MSSIEDSLENHEVPTTKWDEITRSVEANCDSSTAIINKAVQEISMYEEFISPRRSILEARKLEKAFHVSSKLVQSRHKWIDETLLQKPLYSPTNSISSQCTSLSRARSAIEGRRKSRAAAKARASAVMDELQNSKNIAREAAKERAWEALAEIQRSRSLCSRGSGVGSMRSASHEEPDERRQPISSTGSTTLIPVEELREEVEENGVVNVITVGKDEKSENRRHDRPKPDHDDKTKKVRDKGHKKEEKKTPNVKRTRDRKSRSIANKNVQTSNEQGLQGYKKDGSNSFGTLRKEPSSNFLLSDEALMAVSRAALEVAPKVDSFQPSQSQHDNKTAKLTRNNDPSNHKEPYSKRLNVVGAACDTAGSMESNKAYKKTVRSSPNSISLPSEDARTAVSQEALDVTLKFNELRTLRKELRYKEQVKGGVEELIALKDVVSSNQVVANNYNSTLSEKHFDGMASVNNTTSSAKQTLSFLDLKSKNDLTQHRNMPPIDLAKSEASYDELLSSSSSSSDNEQIDIKQVETEDSMREGALDKTMYQGKSLELKNDSDDSADSSYSSAHSHMSSINKSMGPIWQKAIDDAHRARLTRPLSPLKSESTTQVLIQADLGEPLADDETVFNVRTSFHHDRMKCAAIFGVLFLVMNSLFVTLDASSIAIRAFGLVGLISGTFPLMVMWMYLLSSNTQHSFWTLSVKNLLFGCFCQGCTLILFILGSDLGAWAWAAGIISLAWLLLLTVEMSTNSPVLPPSVSGKSESSQSIIGGVMKCLGVFGLSPGAEQEHSESKSRRSLRRRKKNSRLLDGATAMEINQHHQAQYTPPDIILL